MNSNRMKYASTPTFGMQKRGFAKKAAVPQATQTPDFTKQSAEQLPQTPSFGVPLMPAPSAFAPVVNPAANPVNAPQFPQTTIPPYAFPQGGFQQPGYALPNQPSFIPPLGNAASETYAPFAPGRQGFVPPAVPTAGYASRVEQPNFNAQPAMGEPFARMGGNYAPPAAGYALPQMPGMNVPPQSVPPMVNAPASPVAQPFPGAFPGGGEAKPTPRQPLDMERVYRALLFIVIPLLFIPCLFVSHGYDWLRYAFVAVSVLGMSVMWYRQMFSSGARTLLSIVYVALCVVALSQLLSASTDVTHANSDIVDQPVAQQTPAPEATDGSAMLAAVDVAETPSPSEAPGESEAEQRLCTFMDYWSVTNYESMASLVQPSWASTRENASAELFQLLANRVPQEYKLEDISGASSDSSRTVTMTALIDKNNGKDPVRYRFMILMVKESEEWYVDPNSLATNTVDSTEEATTAADGQILSQTLAPRMTVTPVPSSDTKLYYNANGGKYYHANPECTAVNKKYLPLASFLYSELSQSPFSSLEPCLECGAPTKAAN